MGIGRREFMRVFGATVAAVIDAPGKAVSLVDDVYLNRAMGIGFRIPNGWTFVDARDMGSVKEGQILALDDERAARSFLEAMELPFVSVACPTKRPGRFTPSAQFYLVDDLPALQEVGELMGELEQLLNDLTGQSDPTRGLSRTLKKLHDDASACSEYLKSFRILSKPREFQISACDAAEYTACYRFEHQQLASSVTVRCRTIYVNHRIASYLIRLVDSLDSAPEDRCNFDPLVRGIQLV